VRENYDALSKLGPTHLAEARFSRPELIVSKIIQCRSLDSALEELRLDDQSHFMKTDPQGAEPNTLKGTQRYLHEDCVALQLEIFDLPLLRGVPLKEEITDYLDEIGLNSL